MTVKRRERRRYRVGTVERAFQLARSGECGGIGDIKDRLRCEAYDDVAAHLQGPFTRKQLRRLIDDTQEQRAQG